MEHSSHIAHSGCSVVLHEEQTAISRTNYYRTGLKAFANAENIESGELGLLL
jgi:hypothetical protein